MGRYENVDLGLYEGVGEFQFPQVLPLYELPQIDNWIQFNYVKSTNKEKIKTGVNFYITDQQFERVWNSPIRYTEVLSDYGAVIGPDFSTYLNFPKAMRVYNTFRNRWLTRFWQDRGLTVVPEVGWGLKDSWDWCFDGLPQGSIVSVSNIGSMDSAEKRKNFKEGYNEMLKRLQPKEVLFYAHKIDDYAGPVHYIYFKMDKKTQS